MIGRAAAWACVQAIEGQEAWGGSYNSWAAVSSVFAEVEEYYLHCDRTRWAAKRCHVITSVADAMTGQFRAAKIGKGEQFVTVRSGMETEKFLNPIASETREAMRSELGFKCR